MYDTNRVRLDEVLERLNDVVICIRDGVVYSEDIKSLRDCIKLIEEVYEDEVNGI